MLGGMMKNIVFVIDTAIMLLGWGAKLSESFESNLAELKPLLIRQDGPRSNNFSKDNKAKETTKDYKTFSACIGNGDHCKLIGLIAGDFGTRNMISNSLALLRPNF